MHQGAIPLAENHEHVHGTTNVLFNLKIEVFFIFYFTSTICWTLSMWLIGLVVAVVAHLYAPVIGQRETLNIGRSAHFLLTTSWLEESAPALDLPGIPFPVNFFECLSTEFAAGSKPRSTNNHYKASYTRTQQRHQGRGWTQIMRSELS